MSSRPATRSPLGAARRTSGRTSVAAAWWRSGSLPRPPTRGDEGSRPVARGRREATDHAGEQAGKVNRRQVVVDITDDLDADGKAVERGTDGRAGRWQISHRDDTRPCQLVTVRPVPAAHRDEALEALTMVMLRSRDLRCGHEHHVIA